MRILVLITVPDKSMARKIARLLVEKKLAACVNIIDKIESLFWWEGKIDSAKEVLLIAKSEKAKFNKLARLVKANHNYQVPEIIALPVSAGLASYFRWWDEYLR